jgi:hypothetical protein
MLAALALALARPAEQQELIEPQVHADGTIAHDTRQAVSHTPDSREASQSMGEEERCRRGFEQITRHPAEQGLAQPRTPIGAHHDEPRRQFLRGSL